MDVEKVFLKGMWTAVGKITGNSKRSGMRIKCRNINFVPKLLNWTSYAVNVH